MSCCCFGVYEFLDGDWSNGTDESDESDEAGGVVPWGISVSCERAM